MHPFGLRDNPNNRVSPYPGPCPFAFLLRLCNPFPDRYDRDLKYIFAVQDEITMKILTALEVIWRRATRPS